MTRLKNTLPALLIACFLPFFVQAIEVGPMNYQGRLLDSNGIPIGASSPLSIDFVVRIYDDPNTGVLQFEETHGGVQVDDGVYSFQVSTGTRTPAFIGKWDENLWNLGDLYLEIQADGEILSPRTLLTAAPYAFQANVALITKDALALGGRDTNNILQEICEANQGKWLGAVNRCAGNAADLTVITDPGGSPLDVWSDLVSPSNDNDFTNVSLQQANLASMDFSTVDFSGTVFKDTNLDATDFSNATFNGATFDGVSAATPPVLANVDLTDAKILNMDLTGWDLSSANLTHFSAAKLSGCPSSLPPQWECVEHQSDAGNWYLVGASANFSKTSAALISRYGIDTYLDVDGFGAVNDLTGADFGAVYTNLNYDDRTLSTSNFSYSQLVRNSFVNTRLNTTDFNGAIIDSAFFNRSELNATNFNDAVIRNTTFQFVGVDAPTFEGASIAVSTFDQINNQTPFNAGLAPNINFKNSKVRSSLFVDCWMDGMDFSGAAVENSSFYFARLQQGSTVDFTNARLYNILWEFGEDPILGLFDNAFMAFNGMNEEDFTGSSFAGAYMYDVGFSSSWVDGANFSGANLKFVFFDDANLVGADFSNASLTEVDFGGADLTCANFTGVDINSAYWTGGFYETTCPDGNVYTAGGDPNSCLDQLTPAACP